MCLSLQRFPVHCKVNEIDDINFSVCWSVAHLKSSLVFSIKFGVNVAQQQNFDKPSRRSRGREMWEF